MPRLFPAWFTPKRIRITLIVVGCVAALPLFVVEENWRGQHEFERYKRELEAKGEHFDIDWFLGPQVPDDKNFVMAPVFKPLFDYMTDPVTHEITSYNQPGALVMQLSIDVVPRDSLDYSKVDYPLNVKGNWQIGQMRDLEPWQKYYREVLPELALSKSPADDVLAALGKYDGFLSDLRDAAATRQESRFPLKFGPVPDTTEFHGALLRIEGVLAMRAVAELRLGRADDAFTDVKLGFRLIASIRNDPTLVGGLVRLTMLNIIMQPVWEGIASHTWTDEQLPQLEALLQKMDFLEDFESTVRGERAWSAAMWDSTRSSPKLAETEANAMKMLGAGASGDIIRNIGKVMRVYKAVTWQNELFQFRIIQEKILPLVDVKARRVDARGSAFLLADRKGYNPYTISFRLVMPVYANILKKYAEMQTYLDEARVACEIERYRRARGSLPDKLGDLRMADMPRDLIDGNPLRYLIMGANDYRLYSIGWNETDDGGAVGRDSGSDRLDYDKGDWVWSLSPL